MPTYVFSCPDHGRFDRIFRMSEVCDHTPCPSCGSAARRAMAAPMLNLGDSTARRLIDATTATSDRPQVVSAIPGRPRRRQKVTHNPLAAKLPRA